MQIDVAKQFSPYPSGRYPSDGSFSGQKFREDFLVPALKVVEKKASGKLFVDIDGIRTFGSSFLEEAFAGLIRSGLFTREDLGKRLEIVCTKPHLLIFKDAILVYIDEAQMENPERVHV